MRNTECQIVDIETEKPLGFHEQGELWIRGPQVMKGYLNNPEATAKVIDADGWLAINQARSQSNPLYPLLPFFLKNSPELQQAREPKISCQATQSALAESSIICPPVDTKLLTTYFDYFIRSSFLNAK